MSKLASIVTTAQRLGVTSPEGVQITMQIAQFVIDKATGFVKPDHSGWIYSDADSTTKMTLRLTVRSLMELYPRCVPVYHDYNVLYRHSKYTDPTPLQLIRSALYEPYDDLNIIMTRLYRRQQSVVFIANAVSQTTNPDISTQLHILSSSLATNAVFLTDTKTGTDKLYASMNQGGFGLNANKIYRYNYPNN